MVLQFMMIWCIVSVALTEKFRMLGNYSSVVNVLEQAERFVKKQTSQNHCACGRGYGCNCGIGEVFLLLGRIEGTILSLKMLNENKENEKA